MGQSGLMVFLQLRRHFIFPVAKKEKKTAELGSLISVILNKLNTVAGLPPLELAKNNLIC